MALELVRLRIFSLNMNVCLFVGLTMAVLVKVGKNRKGLPVKFQTESGLNNGKAVSDYADIGKSLLWNCSCHMQYPIAIEQILGLLCACWW
jgi:hypothetical protein